MNPFQNINELKNIKVINEKLLEYKDQYIYPNYPCFIYYNRLDDNSKNDYIKGYLVIDSKETNQMRAVSRSFGECGGINDKNLKMMIQEVKNESIYNYMNELIFDLVDNPNFEIFDIEYKSDFDERHKEVLKNIKKKIENSKDIDLNTRLLIKSLSFDEFFYFF